MELKNYNFFSVFILLIISYFGLITSQKISEIKCEEYQRQNTLSQYANGNHIGIVLYKEENLTNTNLCLGTLINEIYVITTAPPIATIKNKDRIHYFHFYSQQNFSINDFQFSPDLNENFTSLALLRLNVSDHTFSYPCIWSNSNLQSLLNEPIKTFAAPKFDLTNGKFVASDDCKNSYPGYFNDEIDMCVITNGLAVTGAPILFLQDNVQYIFGIVKWYHNESSNNYFAVSNLNSFLVWIDSIIYEDYYNLLKRHEISEELEHSVQTFVAEGLLNVTLYHQLNSTDDMRELINCSLKIINPRTILIDDVSCIKDEENTLPLADNLILELKPSHHNKKCPEGCQFISIKSMKEIDFPKNISQPDFGMVLLTFNVAEPFSNLQFVEN